MSRHQRRPVTPAAPRATTRRWTPRPTGSGRAPAAVCPRARHRRSRRCHGGRRLGGALTTATRTWLACDARAAPVAHQCRWRSGGVPQRPRCGRRPWHRSPLPPARRRWPRLQTHPGRCSSPAPRGAVEPTTRRGVARHACRARARERRHAQPLSCQRALAGHERGARTPGRCWAQRRASYAPRHGGARVGCRSSGERRQAASSLGPVPALCVCHYRGTLPAARRPTTARFWRRPHQTRRRWRTGEMN